MKRIILFHILLLNVFLLPAQQMPVEMRITRRAKVIPDNLTSVRTAVIVSVGPGEDWQKISSNAHSQLSRMGIDAIMYINYRDFNASELLREKYTDLLTTRGIRNMIFLYQSGNNAALMLAPFSNNDKLVDWNRDSWFTETRSMNDALYELALGIKRKEFEFTNFLIPDQPEFFQDLVVFNGTHYPSYPTQLKRLPLAITLFTKIELDTTRQYTTEQRRYVNDYNSDVERKNRRIEEILSAYPYKFELTPPIDDQEAYRKGYQFVLRFFNTSGENIKKLLNYEITSQETDYISVVPIAGGGRTLKTIPVDKTVYKYYIKQTIAGDVYVGRYWDAAESWEEALKNYLLHIENDFNR